MHRCPTSPLERMRIIRHFYHDSEVVSFNPHGPVSYSPAERAVCIPNRISHVRVQGSLIPSPTVCLRLSSRRAFILPCGQTHISASRCRTATAPSSGRRDWSHGPAVHVLIAARLGESARPTAGRRYGRLASQDTPCSIQGGRQTDFGGHQAGPDNSGRIISPTPMRNPNHCVSQ
jgi:hypothetical protein